MKINQLEVNRDDNTVLVDFSLKTKVSYVTPKEIDRLEKAWKEDPNSIIVSAELLEESGWYVWISFKKDGRDIASGEAILDTYNIFIDTNQ